MRKKKPLRQIIYKSLIDDILGGRINPGEKLLEAELAKKFRVSRTPIREAFFQLEKDGYVIHKKDVGAVVRKVSVQEVDETLEVIALLESYAVELVVQKKPASTDLAQLLSLIEEMESQVVERKYTEYVLGNTRFHRYFCDHCGNETMSQVIRDMRRKMQRLTVLTLPAHVDQYLVSHRKIFEAIRSGDSGTAGLIMRAHILENRNFLLAAMKAIGYPSVSGNDE